MTERREGYEQMARENERAFTGVHTMFEIDEEKDLSGETINADIRWVMVASSGGDIAPVEGKLYIPRKDHRNEIIIFTPGFPGGNAGRFEMRYAKPFTDAGYSFFTIRHNGTSLTNGATSLEILNSKQRMDLAAERSEHHIGGTRPEGYSPVDITNEPIGPIESFARAYGKIHLMGQSMGVAASYNALRRLKNLNQPHVLEKIGNVVGIAGYIGTNGARFLTEEVWDGLKMPIGPMIDYEYEYVAKVDANMVPKERFKAEMWKVAQQNSEMIVPDHVGNVLVFAAGDPLIDGPEAALDAVDQAGKSAARCSGQNLQHGTALREVSQVT